MLTLHKPRQSYGGIDARLQRLGWEGPTPEILMYLINLPTVTTPETRSDVDVERMRGEFRTSMNLKWRSNLNQEAYTVQRSKAL
jgi:hypothetical protein